MRNPLSILTPRQPSRKFSPSMPSALVAIVTALVCTPLPAVEIDDVAKSNTGSAPQTGISWMSGGVGEDARDEMRKALAVYNVFVIFSDRHGGYLAGIPFAVAGRDGREILAGVSDGPLLLMKLPPAAYRISAQIDGVWQNRHIRAGTSGRPVRTMFVGRAD